MKKGLLASLMAAVMVLSLTACGSTTEAVESTDTVETQTEAVETEAEEVVVEETEYFRVGMECDYAPFNWTQAEATEFSVPIEGGGYADGYDVQIAKAMAEAMGKELVIVKTEWDGLPMALTSGTIDAIIAGMSPTEERKATIDFSDIYWASDMCVVVRADGAYANAASLADLAGAKLTGQLNTSHYDVLDQIPDVNKQEAMESFPQMIVALQSGAIDGYTCETPSALSAIAANSELKYLKFEAGKGFEIDPVGVSCAIGVQKGSDILEALNTALAGISEETRQQMMTDSVSRQPLSQE